MSYMVSLKVGGDRSRVDVEEARAILRRFQQEAMVTTTTLTRGRAVTVLKLDLSCRAWPVESLQILQPFVTQHVVSTVTVLDVDDMIASLPTQDGLAVLTLLSEMFAPAPRLTLVNLSDNAVGRRGIEVLRPLLSSSTLERLYLHNCGLSAADGQTLHDVLLPAAPKRLKALALGRNQMGPDGAIPIGKLLAHCTVLQEFYYDGSRPLQEGTYAICQGLAAMSAATGKKTTRLRILNLNDCIIKSGDGDNAAQHPIHSLCTCLARSPHLIQLILRDGELESGGLQRAVKALHQSEPSLQILDIGGIGALTPNVLRDDLIPFLLETQLCSLQELHMDTNELGTPGLAELIPFLVAAHQLHIFNVAMNELDTAALRLLYHNPIHLLEELNLEDNPDLSPKLAQKVKAMYPTVKMDEELDGDDEEEEEEENEDDKVESLTVALQQTRI